MTKLEKWQKELSKLDDKIEDLTQKREELYARIEKEEMSGAIALLRRSCKTPEEFNNLLLKAQEDNYIISIDMSSQTSNQLNSNSEETKEGE